LTSLTTFHITTHAVAHNTVLVDILHGMPNLRILIWHSLWPYRGSKTVTLSCVNVLCCPASCLAALTLPCLEDVTVWLTSAIHDAPRVVTFLNRTTKPLGAICLSGGYIRDDSLCEAIIRHVSLTSLRMHLHYGRETFIGFTSLLAMPDPESGRSEILPDLKHLSITWKPNCPLSAALLEFFNRVDFRFPNCLKGSERRNKLASLEILEYSWPLTPELHERVSTLRDRGMDICISTS
jgi:hypothetical protein